jgi:serine O-acetyltransferase
MSRTFAEALRDFRADVDRYRDDTRVAADPPTANPLSDVALVLRRHELWALAEHRLATALLGRSRAGDLLAKPPLAILRKLVEILTGILIPHEVRIGPGLYIAHFGGVVFARGVRIGANCNIHHQVTLGEKDGLVPTLGDRVYVAPGVVIMGAVTVGDDAEIGANAVVTRDVPARGVAVGVPARVVKEGTGYVGRRRAS